ncbi:MAG: leucine-rich repeat domain-containing protein [Ruminococcaceae bacterium]|nr:leucine-rich repeat domain-containing protein [Oscillospiraceae bacterium]
MEGENKRISEGKLLYDPLFDKKPDVKISDDPTKGFFGKAIIKKAAFVVMLLIFVFISMFFSFNSIAKDLFAFKDNGDGTFMLDEYHGGNRNVLTIDYVRSEENIPDATKPVTSVRRFAVCCDESVNFIFIGKDVTEIDSKSFYTCKNLYAVIVDAENENFISSDGVLYKCVDGMPTELVLYPIDNGEYRTALAMGVKTPASAEDVPAFLAEIKPLIEAEKNAQPDEDGKMTKNEFDLRFDEIGTKYAIAETVTAVGELGFAYADRLQQISIPEKLQQIGNLGFFKCHQLQAIYLPDGLVSIGSDAFTECRGLTDLFIPASVETIGHHAFHKCDNVPVVRMAVSEEEAKEMELGQNWLPQQRKVLMKDIGVAYNDAREVH